jgi:hypothetical protein
MNTDIDGLLWVGFGELSPSLYITKMSSLILPGLKDDYFYFTCPMDGKVLENSCPRCLLVAKGFEKNS